MANTSKYIPFDIVAPIILENTEYPEYPFFSGTGFFVYFPPYEDIYFVTAKHCMLNNDDTKKGEIKIPYVQGNHLAIQFSECFLTKEHEDEVEFEDVIVLKVSDSDSKNHELLKRRSIRLQHQNYVNSIITNTIKCKENIRLVGFPSVSKELDYDKKQAVAQPRGFYGKISDESTLIHRYKINNLSWVEENLDGYSGSPILSLQASLNSSEVTPVVVGVLLTGTPSCAEFISINVVTNLIVVSLVKANE